MENYNLHRRAQSGWHPTTYSRPVDKKPERNWAALTEAAKRKPRTDNDALEAKYGGGGETTNASPDATAPSSPIPDGARGDELYEPIGTMPVVGDRFVYVDGRNTKTHKFVDVSATSFADRDWAKTAQAQGELWTSESYHCSVAWYAANVKILKRQPRKQVDGRVWKMDRNCAQGSVVSHWANIGGVSYWREDNGSWNRYAVEAGDRLGRASVLSELHGPEADAIIRECAKAMGLDHGTR